MALTAPHSPKNALLAALKTLASTGCSSLSLAAQLPGIAVYTEDDAPADGVSAPYLVWMVTEDPKCDAGIWEIHVRGELAQPLSLSDEIPPSSDYNISSKRQYEKNLLALIDGRWPISGVDYVDAVVSPAAWHDAADFLNASGQTGLTVFPRWQWPEMKSTVDVLTDRGDGCQEFAIEFTVLCVLAES